MRGIALAQLGKYHRALELLGEAARSFRQSGRDLEQARALAAAAEVHAALFDIQPAREMLSQAIETLSGLGDIANACWARLVLARLCVLLGDSLGATRHLKLVERSEGIASQPHLGTAIALCRVQLAVSEGKPHRATRALARACDLVEDSAHPLLAAEVAALERAFAEPIVRVVRRGETHSASLLELAPLMEGAPRGVPLVVDAVKREVRARGETISLAKRLVLLDLLVALATSAEDSVDAPRLIRAAFGGQVLNDSLRARLRVALGRLRRLLSPAARIVGDGSGWRLEPRARGEVVAILPLEDTTLSFVRALLASGQQWSTRSLAAATGNSQRTVQRALAELVDRGTVECVGSGPARHYVMAIGNLAIATQMLLLSLVRPC